MPPKPTYEVSFGGGNLVPSLDAKAWGAMKIGHSGAANNPTNVPDAKGINLSVTRPPGTTAPASIGPHVVLGPNVLPLASRVLLRCEFDKPDAAPPAQGSSTPEPWAVALRVKLGDESEVPNEPQVAVTTQFNRQVNGARLNTPFSEQGDQAPVLLTPLDYSANPQFVYEMEHSFCGINAANGRSIGNGALTIGPPGTLRDQRIYSNVSLSNAQQTWIGALGIVLVTLSGFGQIKVRLRKFSVSLWS